MFVYYYATVPLALEEVEERLDAMVDNLEEWAADAHKSGEAVATRLRLGAGAGVTKEIELRIWPVTKTEGVATRKLTWQATGASSLFPEMDADLVIARLDDELAQLSLRGSYLPPLGLVGRGLNKALLHRVAELTVKQFIDRVVEALVATPTRA